MKKGFLTTDEVAKLLGISTRTVARKVKQGKVLVQRTGGKLRYPREQFEDIEKEEQDTTKTLISTLQQQLIEKDIQIRKLQEDKTIIALQEQLKEKDKQIEKLQISLNNQQGLTKDITDKILLLPEYTEKKKGKKWGFWNKN
jgi:excisionase family DNA binding protein